MSYDQVQSAIDTANLGLSPSEEIDKSLSESMGSSVKTGTEGTLASSEVYDSMSTSHEDTMKTPGLGRIDGHSGAEGYGWGNASWGSTDPEEHSKDEGSGGTAGGTSGGSSPGGMGNAGGEPGFGGKEGT